MTIKQETEARQYISRLRSAAKKRYAEDYFFWQQWGGFEPDHGNLSAMAAQAVRLKIDAILRSE